MQRSTRIILPNITGALQQEVAGVELFTHVHHGDACLAIARRDCRLNWRRPTPARQKRCVQIQTSQTWTFERFTWEDLAVGHDDDDVRLQSANLFDRLPISDARRLQNLYRRSCDRFFDWRRLNALGPSDWFVWLSNDCQELVLR